MSSRAVQNWSSSMPGWMLLVSVCENRIHILETIHKNSHKIPQPPVFGVWGNRKGECHIYLSLFIPFPKHQLLVTVGSGILPVGLGGHFIWLSITHLGFTFIVDAIKMVECAGDCMYCWGKFEAKEILQS